MALFKGNLNTPAAYTATATFEAVLKESYDKTVYKQLNNEVFVLSVMEKKKTQWSGKTTVIALHIGRNSSVTWAGEGTGAIPLPGGLANPDNQDWAKIHVDVNYVYGFFGFTGQAMETCKTKDAIIDACEEEMSKLKDDIKNECDQRMFAGRYVLGFINERDQKGGAGVNSTWEFTGDLQRVRALRLLAAAGGQTLTAKLVRMDDYTALGTAANAVFTVTITAENLTAGTITMQNAGAAIDTRPVTWVGAAGGSPAIPDGYAIAVVVTGGVLALANCALRPLGIFDNLAEQDWYTLNRRTHNDFASGGADSGAGASPWSIQGGLTTDAIDETHALIFTNNVTGDHGRTSMNPTRLQMLEDEMLFRSGGKYDEIIMSPLMQSEYVNLGNQTASLVTTTEAAKKLDLGFSGLAFNNIAIKTAQHCPRGMIIFLTKETWGFYELCPLKFSDRGGGAIMEPGARADYYEGMMKWYFNLACTSPKKNAILVGIDYPGATTL